MRLLLHKASQIPILGCWLLFANRSFARQSALLLEQLPDNAEKAALLAKARQLVARVDAKAPGMEVSALARALAADLVRSYRLTVSPKQAPDLAKAATLFQAQCAWVGYWDDAHGSGDSARAGAAVHGMRELRAVMPVHHAGESEDVGGFDASSLDAWDALVAGAAAGDPTLPRQYLRANC